MSSFIANHPFIVLLSFVLTIAILANIGSYWRKYENAYGLPHVLSNAVFCVVIVCGCFLIFGISQMHVEKVKTSTYKDLDMTQTFVFNSKQKKDDTDGLLTKGYHALFGNSNKKENPTVDTSKTITADMVDYLKDNECLNTTMVVSKDNQKVEQTVMLEKVNIKGELQKGSTAKITKIAFRKPNKYRTVVFGQKASHDNKPSNDGAVTITIEIIDNPVNKQFN